MLHRTNAFEWERFTDYFRAGLNEMREKERGRERGTEKTNKYFVFHRTKRKREREGERGRLQKGCAQIVQCTL